MIFSEQEIRDSRESRFKKELKLQFDSKINSMNNHLNIVDARHTKREKDLLSEIDILKKKSRLQNILNIVIIVLLVVDVVIKVV
jgi:hypothetical protein